MKRNLFSSFILGLMLTIGVSATSMDAVHDADYLLYAELTPATLSAITAQNPLELSSDMATVTISESAAEAFQMGDGNVVLSLSSGIHGMLTQDELEQVGENDLYLLSISYDGAPLLGWGGDALSISLPYSATEGAVQVWQLSNSLSHSYSLSSSYDQEMEVITFQTNESGYIAMATNPFSDVNIDSYDYISILWAADHGIVSGTEVGLFSPDDTCTRAMIATVLWRMSGEQDWGICYPYADVEADMWYTDAIYWCTVNGIVSGYGDETFRPDVAITREQLVSMLYRYAQYLEVDVTVGENTNILSYADAFDISEYAMASLQWGCGSNVVEGTGTALYPLRDATRSELVSMLMRLSTLQS